MLRKGIFLLTVQLFVIHQVSCKYGENTKTLAKNIVSSVKKIDDNENGKKLIDNIINDKISILTDEKAGKAILEIVEAFKQVLKNDEASKEISKFAKRIEDYLTDKNTMKTFDIKGKRLFKYLSGKKGPKKIGKKMDSLKNLLDSESVNKFLDEFTNNKSAYNTHHPGIIAKNVILALNLDFTKVTASSIVGAAKGIFNRK